jgi:hypothetical protein
MKIFALFIAFIALIVSPLTLAGGSEAESIAQLKAQIA